MAGQPRLLECQYPTVNNITGKGEVSGQDFTPFSGNNTGGRGRPRKDHIITLDMAKELSMIQRTEKGKQWSPPPGTYMLTSGFDSTDFAVWAVRTGAIPAKTQCDQHQ